MSLFVAAAAGIVPAASAVARATSHVHLTPGEFNSIWHLTQAIGKFFWQMSPTAQCVTVGVPSAAGVVWLCKWDPLVEKKQIQNKPRKKLGR